MKRKKLIFLVYIIISNTFLFSQQKILFDNTKSEQASNADWVIDNDSQIPLPNQSGITESTAETFWSGALSSWGIEMVNQGFWVETLPSFASITYGDVGNTQDLSKYDIFVLCEPNNPFTSVEKNAILDFVSNGGGLFMIADHPIADRDGDGWAAVHIFNDLMSGNPFGIQFSITDDVDEVPSLNIADLPGDPLLHGIKGDVAGIEFHGGASMIINVSDNATVKAVVYQTGFSNTGTTGVMAAYASYGAGRVVGIGDSSVAEDETSNDGTTYPGWIQPIGGVADGDDGTLVTNATIWLAGETIVLPEPSNNVTNFIVSETTSASITLTWTDATTGQLPDAYLIKAVVNPNLITDPSDEIAEPNSTFEKNVIYGNESVVFNELNHSTFYDFKIYPYTNSGSNIDFLISNTPIVQGLTLLGSDILNSENFSDCANSTWFAYNVAGATDFWDCSAGYQDINGYEDEADEDWLLLSNPINFDNYSAEELTFKTDESWDGPDLEILYSTDYLGSGDPSLSNWNAITHLFHDSSTDGSFSGWYENVIDLSGLTGTLYIGFKYIADGSGGGSEYWRIDDIKITGNSSFQTPSVSISNTPDCSSGTITVSSNLPGVQTFYLFNSDGTSEIENSGAIDASFYHFNGQVSGNYRGKVLKEGNLSEISSLTSLSNLTTTTISTQPEDVNAVVGEDRSLNVIAAGDNLAYQWRKNETDIGSNSSTYILNDVQLDDAGNYDVIVSGNCGDITSDVAVLAVGSNSVKSLSELGIEVFPNPSEGTFYIRFKESVNPANIKISDMTGKVFYTQIFDSSLKHEIRLKSIAKGIYFIQFKLEGKSLVSKLIIE